MYATIRKANKKDIPRIRKFCKAVLKSRGDAYNEKTDNDIEQLTTAYSNGLFLLFEDTEHKIIATSAFIVDVVPSDGVLAYMYTIRRIYVHPDYRNMGYGKLMLATVLGIIKIYIKKHNTASTSSIILHTHSAWKSAVQLYKSVGFKVGGTITKGRTNISMYYSKDL
jgi:GNAT superfamily N-acetyltransferase